MRSVNKVVLIGYLAADPEIRETKNKKKVATFPLATNRDWITSEGEAKQATDFHRIVAWTGLANIAEKFLTKGMGIYVDGRISNRSYENQKGEKKFVTEIIADTMNMLTWKKDGKTQELHLETPVVA